MIRLRVLFDLRTLRRAAAALLAMTAFFAAGTIIFIAAWAQREQYQGAELAFLKYVLVQTHLATENVVAAWFSSMLLMAVAMAALIAYSVQPRSAPIAAPHWLRIGWLVIAGVFTLLSLDELGSLHERIGGAVTLGRAGGWGWVYVLALPIAAVGAYLLAFAWRFVRPVGPAFRLFVIGVACFLSNPLVEQIQMSLIHGPGAETGTTARFVHDALLVLEEGLLELLGTLCFLAAVVIWIRANLTADEPALQARIEVDSVARPAAIAALVVMLGIPVSAILVSIMPVMDSGIPMNWFPAASAFMLSALTFSARAAMPLEAIGSRRGAMALGALALAISAYFGAGIHGYTDWGALDALRELLRTTLAVGFAVVCVLLSKAPHGGRIGALLAAAVLMACAINVSGPHAALMASFAAVAAAIGVVAAFSESPVSNPRSSIHPRGSVAASP